MSLHVAGVAGLILVFLIGTLRPINLGVLALVMSFLVGTAFAGESVKDITSGFPVELFILLVGVTYLFAIAEKNGTVERVVLGSARWVEHRRALIPWVVFVLAALPPMAGALGSAGVALLAPLSLRMAERYDIDRRMIGLMVAHGASAGNFSPLNVLSAIVVDAVHRNGLEMSASTLLFANLAYNVVLGAVIYVGFGGLQLGTKRTVAAEVVGTEAAATREGPRPISRDQICTLMALTAVAVLGLGFSLHIGFVALAAAGVLQLAFPVSSTGTDKRIAWDAVLLVCGIVTYVTALQRHGTVEAVGTGIAGLGTAVVAALLLCAVGAVTSAFASSAGILGALIPLAVPLMARGEIGTTGLVVALAISATVVDATPFSTVGALVVANAADNERPRVYRGLLLWGALMVITAPPLTWLIFIVF
jgi:di/tricarboxylate transporter